MRNINAKITKRDKDEFVDLLRAHAVRRAEFEAILTDMFTPAELHEFTARLQIVKRLAQKASQREVCRDLHVALQTVARGARVLESGSGVLAKAVHHKGIQKT
jgi:Trp operon repressor